MQVRQETIQSNPHEENIQATERRLVGVLILAIGISTAIFIIHNIISADMNYDYIHVNILCYFTIQSNIIISIWLLAIAICILSKFSILKWSMSTNLSATVTTYILVTGIIYWAVLIPIYSKSSENSWLYSASNIWLHTTTPIISVFLHHYIRTLNRKNTTRLNLILFFIYPAFYLALAIAYAVNGMYIYPMFNPTLLGGWGGVAACIMVITVIFTGIYIFLLKFNLNKKS